MQQYRRLDIQKIGENFMKYTNKAAYKCSVYIANTYDIISFAQKISQMQEFKKLTSDQKLNIICSYPVDIMVK